MKLGLICDFYYVPFLISPSFISLYILISDPSFLSQPILKYQAYLTAVFLVTTPVICVELVVLTPSVPKTTPMLFVPAQLDSQVTGTYFLSEFGIKISNIISVKIIYKKYQF